MVRKITNTSKKSSSENVLIMEVKRNKEVQRIKEENDKGGTTHQNGKQKGKRKRTKEVCTQEY